MDCNRNIIARMIGNVEQDIGYIACGQIKQLINS